MHVFTIWHLQTWSSFGPHVVLQVVQWYTAVLSSNRHSPVQHLSSQNPVLLASSPAATVAVSA